MIRDMVIKELRRLSKSNYYQMFYMRCKEISSLRLFKNDMDLTDLQMTFLHFLEFYSELYTDYAMGECGDIVFDNDVFEDAYYAYKSELKKKQREEMKKGNKTPYKEPSLPEAPEDKSIVRSSWLFKNPKK